MRRGGSAGNEARSVGKKKKRKCVMKEKNLNRSVSSAAETADDEGRGACRRAAREHAAQCPIARRCRNRGKSAHWLETISRTHHVHAERPIEWQSGYYMNLDAGHRRRKVRYDAICAAWAVATEACCSQVRDGGMED